MREGDLYAGDTLAEVDVVVDRSFASRFNEWVKQPSKPAATTSRVAIIEDADPATEGKDRYADTLAAYDAAGGAGGAGGSPVWRYDALNVSKYSTPVLEQNPADGSVWVCESGGRRVLRFDSGGKLLWEKDGLKVASRPSRRRSPRTRCGGGCLW